MPVPRSPASTLRRSTLAMLVFWLMAAALLYAVFEWFGMRERARLQPYVSQGGELVIPRSPDGHFYVSGEVNHQPARFLIDTGASTVAISEQLAASAGLPRGNRITLGTAAGQRSGWLVHSVPVRAGPLIYNETSVTVGVQMGAPENALLGQSFLRHFDLKIEADRMVLQSRGNPSPD